MQLRENTFSDQTDQSFGTIYLGNIAAHLSTRDSCSLKPDQKNKKKTLTTKSHWTGTVTEIQIVETIAFALLK